MRPTIRIAHAPWRAAVPDARAIVRRAVRAALAVAPDPGAAEMTVMLADDALLRDLNRTWRGKDKPTNVLSFPAGPESDGFLGDIAIAFETCRREAAADGIAFRDHAAHLIVHGLLHLAGCDHEEEDEAEAMEGLERRILAAIGVADPYGAPDDPDGERA